MGGHEADGARQHSQGPGPLSPHPTPYTLHPTHHTLHPTPYILHPAANTLHPSPYTLHPTPLLGANEWTAMTQMERVSIPKDQDHCPLPSLAPSLAPSPSPSPSLSPPLPLSLSPIRLFLPLTVTPQRALCGGIPCSFLEPFARSWSHFVGIYRQNLTRSLEN